MYTFQDPSKKTSINSLLNPPETASAFPNAHLPNLPASAGANHSPPHAHQAVAYSPYSNGSSYHLRAANWGSDEAGERKAEEAAANGRRHYPPAMPPPEMYTANHASRGPRMRTGSSASQSSAGLDAEAWQPPAEPHHNILYGPAVPGPMYPDGRAAGFNGLQPQSQSDSVIRSGGAGQKVTELTSKVSTKDNYGHNYETSGTSQQSDSTVWQNSERVSVRLAARGLSAAPQQPMSYHSQSYYGQPADTYFPAPYPPTGSNVPATTHQQQEQHSSSSETQPRVTKPSSSKRQLPEGEADASAPKAKRPAKAKSKTGPDGVPIPSKRGFNAKKRNEAAQIAAQNAQLAPTVTGENGKERPDERITVSFDRHGSPALSLLPELQFARCMSNRYRKEDFPRCVSCTRRWAGDTCRFQGIRFFLKDRQKNIKGISFAEAKRADAPAMQFPTEWNIPLRQEHIGRTKKVIAKALLATLKQERRHLDLPELIRRPRESDVRVTCDTCMTSIFSSSWMCRLCGREACMDCFELVRELTEDPPGASPAEREERRRRKDKHAHNNPFFLSCTRRNEHEVKEYSPMSRFFKDELDGAIAEMEQLLLHDTEPANVNSDPGGSNHTPNGQAPKSNEAMELTPTEPAHGSENSWISIYKANQLKPSYLPPSLSPSGAAGPEYIWANLPESTALVPTYEAYRFTDDELAGDAATKFAKIWGHGEPLVVANILKQFKLDWTPEYFIREFGDRECLITECEMDINKRTTIKEFFEGFGKYESRNEFWKLKDWPPSADFKSAFPKLYKDFSEAVPVPDYVRRDGVYNIGSHFPSNVIGPDLGPKMYNAWAASQKPGSKATTRLHMDMADALNVMLYTAPCPDGSPGCAVWDIYRAGDSDKVRNFLRKKHSLGPNYDPIHGQQYYLDDNLRLQLYKDYGVTSYRIYQRPGEAIFIPAGCAHQVFNLADSIKIAIDYVSPENIDRCAKLTMEFREQNKSKVWKEDVLQLKTMMWFAWLSCCKQEAALAP